MRDAPPYFGTIDRLKPQPHRLGIIPIYETMSIDYFLHSMYATLLGDVATYASYLNYCCLL